MDWVTQDRFRRWLIVILLATNLLAVAIIWMQTARRDEVQPKGRGPRASESVQLLRRALGLTEEQAGQLTQLHKERREQSRAYQDRITLLKIQLAEELFAGNPDTALADLKAIEIGELQANVESIRFRYFNEVLAICTPEQKEKLKPIVIEVFGRKPPREEVEYRDGKSGPEGAVAPRDNGMSDNAEAPPARRRDERPGPPSVDEKLARYSERLNLTDEQRHEIRAVLLATQQKGEELRMRPNSDPDDMQMERERIRSEEDDAVLKILNEDQKKDFHVMMLKRRK